MELITPTCTLRKWSAADGPALVYHANHSQVAQWMRDGFPSPYTREDADRFITMATSDKQNLFFAIDVNGEAVGGIGIHPLSDVYRKTAEIGYWLSPAFQGRGIVTDAVQVLVPIAFDKLDINRIQAGVFHRNLPSIRILEKNGFKLEAIHKNAIWKNGMFMDECLYVYFSSGLPVRKETII